MVDVNKPVGLATLYRKRIAAEAITVACDATAISSEEVLSKDRAKSTIVFARQLAMYLAHVVGQLSLGQVALEFGRDRTTVAYSWNSIEDRRDSPIFDDQVDAMEAQLRERLTAMLTRDVDLQSYAPSKKLGAA
ncbi:MAG: helix-turn-helix domain-containing protein [Pseudomonadota bacterium]